MRRQSAFTLLELLIVVAIIGVLATLLLGALSAVGDKANAAAAKSQISAIKAALAAYETDMGRFPRLSPIPTAGGAVVHDEAPALYVALRNQPGRGGGPNSPYLQDWKAEDVGVVDRSKLVGGAINAAKTGISGVERESGDLPAERLSATDAQDINDLTFQANHDPMTGSQGALVLLDPWGNPYHYREWASVRRTVKNGLTGNEPAIVDYSDPDNNPGPAVITDPVKKRAHNPDGFVIWSNGPNGINEWGHPESDDVCSWR